MSQSQKPQPTKPTTTYATVAPPSDSHTVDLLDAILDEIDEALEDNALETVRTFVQKPGQ